MKTTKKLAVITVTLLYYLNFSTLANACPSCAATMEKGNNSSANQSRVDGYQYSIMMMMSAPFFIIGGFAFYVHRSIKRKNKTVN